MTDKSRSVVCRMGVGVALTLVLAAFPIPSRAQDGGSEHVIRFSDPGRPGLLRLNLLHANAEVIAYDGDEVIIVSEGGISLSVAPRPPRGPGRGLAVRLADAGRKLGLVWRFRKETMFLPFVRWPLRRSY